MRYMGLVRMWRMRYKYRMRLADWLLRHQMSDADFARRIGSHRTEVWNYRTGRRMPRADKVADIERATRGEVRAKDFRESA